MAGRSKAISDDLYEQAKISLKSLGRSGESGRRLQAIISAKHKSITSVASVYGITRGTLLSWIKSFKNESTAGLKIKPGRGPKRKIMPELEDEIKGIIQANPNITIDELRLQVIEKYKITPSRSTVYRLMKKLSFSYVTPRPRHYKAKTNLQEDFKKKYSSED